MNVEQLIEELKKHDPEKMVVIAGYEGGYDEATAVTGIRLRLEASFDPFCGKYEEARAGETRAVFIGDRTG